MFECVRNAPRLARGIAVAWLTCSWPASTQLDADFTVSTTSGPLPLTVEFTDATTGGTPVSWLWNFGDGDFALTFEGTSTHTYLAPGTYTATLTVQPGFDYEVKRDLIVVESVSLQPGMTASPSSGVFPLTVQFEDATTGTPPTAWSWSFGDGSTSTQQDPVHTYNWPGIYEVSLTVFVGEQSETVVTPLAIVVEPPDHVLLHHFAGESPGYAFGEAVAGAGDFDNDGIPDIIVGSQWADSYAGRAYVFSGHTGESLATFSGAKPGDRLGFAVAGAGDVDADGTDDVVVGAYQADANGPYSGTVFVYAGGSGEILHELMGETGDYFGWSVDGAGDVDGDAFGDVIVGAAGASLGLPETGAAFVYSGRTGELLHAFYGDENDKVMGSAVAGVGDIDGDDRADVVVGDWRATTNGPSSGLARVFSGATGAVLHEFYGDTSSDYLGWSVAAADDVDADGVGDIIVGAPGANAIGPSGYQSGSAHVYSGSTGALLHVLNGFIALQELGTSVAGVGDVDGDGHGDLLVGAPGDDPSGYQSGSAFLFSGDTGDVLTMLGGDSVADAFGAAVARIGDIDEDGVDEIASGADGDDPIPGSNAGSVYVYSLVRTECDGRAQAYGAGLAGAGRRVPRLSGSGCAEIGASFGLEVQNGLGGTYGLVLIGASPTALAFKGGTLVVSPPFLPVAVTLRGGAGVPGAGEVSIPIALDAGSVPDVPFYVQGVLADRAASQGVSITNGLEIVVAAP